MHAGHTRIERHADNVQIVAGIGDKLFLSNAAHSLNLVAYARGLFKFQILAGFFHSGDQLGQNLIVFPG